MLLFLSYLFNFVPFLILSSMGITLMLSLLSSKVMLGDNSVFILSEHKSYECSFEYGIGSSSFSLQFYIVSLSFLLFDLEICLFTPLVVSLGLSSFAFKMSFIFLLLVLFLLIYEYMTSALDWY